MAKKSKSDKTLFAFLATFFSIIGFIIALIVRRDDKYVMHYAKISLVIFIFYVLFGIVSLVFSIVPVFGTVIEVAINVALCLVWILSWVYALSGEMKTIPVVSDLADKLDF